MLLRLKKYLILLLLLNYLSANDCSPYFAPSRFYDVPEELAKTLDNITSENNISLFGTLDQYQKLNFTYIKNNEYIKEKSFLKQVNMIYPTISGIWKYMVKNDKINEINIARSEIYRFSDIDAATDTNDRLGEFWNDWEADAYEMQLVPAQTLFKHKDYYFSFSVFIYGVAGDATNLKGTSINYRLLDYTKEVNEHIECKKTMNDNKKE